VPSLPLIVSVGAEHALRERRCKKWSCTCLLGLHKHDGTASRRALEVAWSANDAYM
jgi:hypothetical protein